MNPTNDERARFEFEVWAQETLGFTGTWLGSRYGCDKMQAAYKCWMHSAARYQSAPASQGEAVAYQLRCNGGYWSMCGIETFKRGRCDVAGHTCEVRALYNAPQPSAPGVVTDAMVDAACAAHDSVGWGVASGETTADMRHWMRKALRAALAAQPSADDAPLPSGEAVAVAWTYTDSTGRTHYTANKTRSDATPLYPHPSAFISPPADARDADTVPINRTPSNALLRAMAMTLGMDVLAEDDYPIAGKQSTVRQCYDVIVRAADRAMGGE